MLKRFLILLWKWLNLPIVFPLLVVAAAFVFLVDRYRTSLKAVVVLEYLKVFLSPQVVVGAVAVFFLVRFSRSVEAMIERLSQFKAAGVEATFVREQRQATDQGQQAVEQAQPAQQTEALQRVARWWLFEKIYRFIFLSQIFLLRALQVAPGRAAPWSQLFVFYQQGILQKGVPATDYPYPNYMQFLKNWNLIQWQTPAGAVEAVVSLTAFGNEFLEYLNTQNYIITERPY